MSSLFSGLFFLLCGLLFLVLTDGFLVLADDRCEVSHYLLLLSALLNEHRRNADVEPHYLTVFDEELVHDVTDSCPLLIALLRDLVTVEEHGYANVFHYLLLLVVAGGLEPGLVEARVIPLEHVAERLHLFSPDLEEFCVGGLLILVPRCNLNVMFSRQHDRMILLSLPLSTTIS